MSLKMIDLKQKLAKANFKKSNLIDFKLIQLILFEIITIRSVSTFEAI